MDRIYFSTLEAAVELQQLLTDVANKRNYIGHCSYQEAALVKNVYETIGDLKQLVQNIIADQHEYISQTE